MILSGRLKRGEWWGEKSRGHNLISYVERG
jgi:hypothetical protein